ncbi:MAG: AAA family ATPase [Gallionella sp.]
MYLEHFGLTDTPFGISPGMAYFFSDANRGEILDALIDSVSSIDGIVKVSGETGSGKTTLCQMLIERLPKHIQTIYLANPDLSLEEILAEIAKALDLKIGSAPVDTVLQSIRNKLVEKARQGKRVVVLVDDAHAMPLKTLEELHLLYNMQFGSFKLLQIILFGQAEFDDKLDQPGMRELKDRIVHHFRLQPLSSNDLENYLTFRMRAAGYSGPHLFSPNAIELIADLSKGLMHRINILADRSLLAAFAEGTHKIEARHVQKAMHDNKFKPPSRSMPGKKLLIASVAAALLLIGPTAWRAYDKSQVFQQHKGGDPSPPPPPTHANATQQTTPFAQPTNIATNPAIAPPAPAVSGPTPKSDNGTTRVVAMASTTLIDTPPVESGRLKLRLDMNLTFPRHK